jgi:translation initiation factor IF-2
MSKNISNPENKIPVIAILGHVDHGKSTLLDYIRKSNVVDQEIGGITQAISAYVAHYNGEDLTFLDTPGHESFQSMRERGVEIANIAVLVVSAEDGVKTQTLQAYKSIKESGIPFLVAINKIDKPGADIIKTKNSLVENGIYPEGMGGDVTCVPLSAKTGENINELLDNILLIRDMSALKSELQLEATGKVLESFIDKKRGISATLVIESGTLPESGAILAGASYSPIRIIEDFRGKQIKSPIAGLPIKVTGFDTVPEIGSTFISSKNKKNIELLQSEALKNIKKEILDPKLYRNAKVVIPVIIKAKSQGALEAVRYEIMKNESGSIKIKIINASIGNIMLASGDSNTVVLGFEVQIEANAKEQADRFDIVPERFDIIYKLSERFLEILDKKLPYEEKEKIIGKFKVIKTFSTNKDLRVLGGKVIEGVIRDGANVKIIRRDYEIGKGKITNLQQMKMKVSEVQIDSECGLEVLSKIEIIPGDNLTIVEIERTKLI